MCISYENVMCVLEEQCYLCSDKIIGEVFFSDFIRTFVKQNINGFETVVKVASMLHVAG
jgi:hypothetical protein